MVGWTAVQDFGPWVKHIVFGVNVELGRVASGPRVLPFLIQMTFGGGECFRKVFAHIFCGQRWPCGKVST